MEEVWTQSGRRAVSVSKKRVLAGRILSGLAILFLLFDAVSKVLKAAPSVEGTIRMGFPSGVIVPMGLVLLALTVAYAIPRTAVLGAVLLTGYLGGAVAAQLRLGASAFEISFPILFAVVMWAGILLRDDRLREIFPLRS
jgi:DoxX-like family